MRLMRPWTLLPPSSSRVIFPRSSSSENGTTKRSMLPTSSLSATSPSRKKYAHYQAKRFRKAPCPIGERLAWSLMMPGRSNAHECPHRQALFRDHPPPYWRGCVAPLHWSSRGRLP
uniref:Ribosomal protein n=1 Tax=Pristionchus pacificus TaxID=54126 RepID=A0A8R1UTV1_PRIPA